MTDAVTRFTIRSPPGFEDLVQLAMFELGRKEWPRRRGLDPVRCSASSRSGVYLVCGRWGKVAVEPSPTAGHPHDILYTSHPARVCPCGLVLLNRCAWWEARADSGFVPPTLENWFTRCGPPGLAFLLTRHPGFRRYWRHVQHRFAGGGLHSVPHARPDDFWTDTATPSRRGHRRPVVRHIALLIGVPQGRSRAGAIRAAGGEPSHANVKLSFGRVGKLLVSPRFHRLLTACCPPPNRQELPSVPGRD